MFTKLKMKRREGFDWFDTGQGFGTSSYKWVKSLPQSVCGGPLGISSGRPAGPERRRCPPELVPFWTPPEGKPRRQKQLRGATSMMVSTCWVMLWIWRLMTKHAARWEKTDGLTLSQYNESSDQTFSDKNSSNVHMTIVVTIWWRVNTHKQQYLY